jgi:hypothetical protein
MLTLLGDNDPIRPVVTVGFREAHFTVSTAKQGRHRTHEDSPAKLYGFAATPCSASATQCPPRLI